MQWQRRTILAMGAAMALSAWQAQAAEPKWPAKPSIPTDFNAEEFVHELDEKGAYFTSGNPKAKAIAYMVIDAQCPWCAWEYEQMLPFMGDVQFRWYPVAVLNPWSELQGATFLDSSDPLKLYDEHRELIKNKDFKGIDVRGKEADIPMERRMQVWTNSKIYRRAGGRSVPFGVLKTPDGQLIPLPEENTMGFSQRTGLKPSPMINTQ